MTIKKYGNTQTENWATDSFQARQIVNEVMKFGVSQSQILKIIYLLSLELEDRNAMLQISTLAQALNEDPGEESGGIITT